jgi:hypothetical protein
MPSSVSSVSNDIKHAGPPLALVAGWINLVVSKALFLVPLTRFPGFVWLIAAGFAMPKTVARSS